MNWILQYLPCCPEHSDNEVLGVRVDQESEAVVGLLQHEQIWPHPGDQPPLPIVFHELITSQLTKLLIKCLNIYLLFLLLKTYRVGLGICTLINFYFIRCSS